MIVDDEQELLEFYIDALELLGFAISGAASNGDESVKMFFALSDKADIILMDHRTPVKSGLEAAEEILAGAAEAKIIIASADRSVEHDALSAGIGLFLK